MKTVIRIIIALLFIAAAVCGYFFFREYNEAQQEVSEYSDIQNEYTTIIYPPAYDPGNDPPSHETEQSPELKLPYVDVDFDALLLINPDTVGWIAIPDTNINYPVVQTTNNYKYLNVSFEGNQTKAGTLFVDKDNDIINLDINTIIYGHNFGAGRSDMFCSLLSYKDNEFYETHRYIQFDTVYELHGFWKVFAVIELNVHNSHWRSRTGQLQ